MSVRGRPSEGEADEIRHPEAEEEENAELMAALAASAHEAPTLEGRE